MKKTIIIVLLLALAVAAFVFIRSALNSSKLADIYNEDAVISRAKEVIDVINTHDYEAINAELRADLQEKLPADSLMTSLDSILTNAGAFEKYTTVVTAGQKSKSTGEDYAVVILVCAYENSNLTFTISMDKDLQIVSMFLK